MPEDWSPRIARPDTFHRAGWLIYEHVNRAVVADPSREGILNRSQALVHALYELRTEVNADGFEGYFQEDYGDRAIKAILAAQVVGARGWRDLIAEASTTIAKPYLVAAGERRDRIDALLDADEDVFNRFDDRLYDLEITEPLDDLVDRFVEQQAHDFFEPGPGDLSPEGAGRA